MKKVAVIMGSASDLPVARKAADTLGAFGVPCEVHVYSAHRTPAQAAQFAQSARENGFGAIIAAAGCYSRHRRGRQRRSACHPDSGGGGRRPGR